MDMSVIAALVPIFLMIVIGYLLKRSDFPGDAFWPLAERLVYFLLFPALLFHRTATAAIVWSELAGMVMALIVAIVTLAALLLLIRPWMTTDGPAFTSLFQGGIRFNTYVGLAAAAALLGDNGLLYSAVAIAVLVPLVNLLCVLVLVRFAGAGVGLTGTLAQLTKNPLILACVLGMGINAVGVSLPAAAIDLVAILGRASLPLGLLAVGAGLSVRAAHAAGARVAKITAFKLLLAPAVMWLACQLFAVSLEATMVAVLFAALPGAPTSYILARQLGGDGELMASVLTVQTAIAVLTLPLVLGLLR